MTFDHETTTRVYSLETRRLIEERVTQGRPPGATLIETAAALVFDSSVAGPTAPVLGTRSRFEVAPTLGEMAFVTVTADYRRYFMPVRPLTLAFRAQHTGRYGPGAADPRLLPLAWTLRDLVRGFNVRDLGAGCAVSGQDCPTIAGLGARQLVVSNGELRLPLVGPFGRLSDSSALPVDGLLFADGGAFTEPRAGGTGATMLYSAGAGVRLNAGGFIFEFDVVRPLAGTDRGWTVALNFRPGF
jgi:outer membrane protein assembly factor BamA